jgi:hypothetical protein
MIIEYFTYIASPGSIFLVRTEGEEGRKESKLLPTYHAFPRNQVELRPITEHH